MLKREEIIELGEKMLQGQAALTKYVTHYTEFFNVPRCKKGIIEFLNELFDQPTGEGEIRRWQFDYNDLMIQLTTGKSHENSWKTCRALKNSNIEADGFKEIVRQRNDFMNAIADYLVHTREELEKSELIDARERQVYLRRAVARLLTVCVSRPLVTINASQWSEVTPWEYCDYLSLTMDELVSRLRPSKDTWLSVDYQDNGLDCRENVQSILNFLDYLDTFLKY